MSCCENIPLNFSFSTKDPNFVTNTVVINNEPNFISHSFVRCPIYDKKNKRIGYKVSDDYVQQVDVNKYIVRLNNSYYFDDRGSISWQYVFKNTKPEIYYPVGVPAISTIICGTGEFKTATGTVKLLAYENGTREVKIKYSKH